MAARSPSTGLGGRGRGFGVGKDIIGRSRGEGIRKKTGDESGERWEVAIEEEAEVTGGDAHRSSGSL